MIKKCPECGMAFPKSAMFCLVCGKKLREFDSINNEFVKMDEIEEENNKTLFKSDEEKEDKQIEKEFEKVINGEKTNEDDVLDYFDPTFFEIEEAKIKQEMLNEQKQEKIEKEKQIQKEAYNKDFVNHSEGKIIKPYGENNEPPLRSAFSGILSFLWIVFGGLALSIFSFFYGIGLCLTIIGIPSGIAYIKALPILLNPVGKKVVTNFGKHKFLNTISIIFGLIPFIFSIAIGLALSFTIIGIPLGKQIFKISMYFLAPYGAEIITDGQYTRYRYTSYDINIVGRKISENPYVKIHMSDGTTCDLFTAMIPDEYAKKEWKQCCKYRINADISISICFILAIIISYIFCLGLIIFIIFQSLYVRKAQKIAKKYIVPITYYYAPTDGKAKHKKTYGIKEIYNTILLLHPEYK